MKVDGTYQSVIRGVSQQAPADRIEGQHGEAVNMVFDPVRGAVRRNGMVLENYKQYTFTEDPEKAIQDSLGYRVFSYRDGELDFHILYPSRPRTLTPSGGFTDAHLDTLLVRPMPLYGSRDFVPVVRRAGDTALSYYDEHGISAITAVGSYVLMAANDRTPTYSAVDQVDGQPWSNTASIWVRGGAYARTYTVKAKRADTGADFSVSYTTPTSVYTGSLSFSGINTSRPDATLKISQRQADYNTKVNQHVDAAARAIVPDAIAKELANRLNNAGFPGWTTVGSHLVNSNVAWLEVDDGGNGEYIRGVLREARDTDDLPDVHRVGKVIRVKPRDGDDDAYYLKAEAKQDGSTNTYQEVVWREAAGVLQTPLDVFSIGRYAQGKFYWASSPEQLQLLLDENGISVKVPQYEPSTSGDLDSNPTPSFFDRPISYLGVFQDRLLIGSGSVVTFSAQSDYFTWYRTTALTVPDSDPTEVTASGTEADTIRHGSLYDRNLILTGDKFVYTINGRENFTATKPNMSVQFSMVGAGGAAPAGLGKYVYLLKEDAQVGASRLMQIRSGPFQDSPVVDDVSKQLRDYVNGYPAEIVTLPSPNAVFVRTEYYAKSMHGFPRSRPWGLYLYQYLDAPDETRLFEAWGAWEWSTALGMPIGIADAGTGDALAVYTMAVGTDENGDRAISVMAHRVSVRPDPTGLPYLDGMRPAADAQSTGMLTPLALDDVRSVVYTAPSAVNSFQEPDGTDEGRWGDVPHPHYTVGDAPPETIDGGRWTGVQGWILDYVAQYPGYPVNSLYTGTAFPAYIDLTNPFVRDREGKAVLEGRLTLTSLQVTTTRTAGLRAWWRDHDGYIQSSGFEDGYHRIRYSTTVWVGRETKDVQIRLEAINWWPLTINSIAWKGNWFKY